jgi:phenylpropionate dioxygenase-like ring-hydroxylating dioxygenase large terminal subunit
MDSIRSALGRYHSGDSLPSEFYISPEIFDLEFEHLLTRHWVALGHHSSIPKAGDFFVTEVAGESLVVTRDGEGNVRVLANVCTHRGSRLIHADKGTARAFVCPYHSWTFGLDGNLLQASSGPADLDRYPLHRFPVRVVGGFIMTCLGPDPLDLDPAEEAISRYLDPHCPAGTVVAARTSYSFRANWKLVLENFLECYHCPTAHPEYCRTNPNAYHFERGPRGRRYASQVAQWWEEMRQIGHVFGMTDQDCLDHESGREYYLCMRTPLTPGYQTATRDGMPVAPLLGTLSRFDGGETYVGIGPYSFVFGYGDYLVLFRIVPHARQRTEMELTWLVAPGAELLQHQSGLDDLTWLWHTTSVQDVRLTDGNALGVASRFYRPGPYSDGEAGVRRWIDWYVATIAAATAPMERVRG